mmetsp:Transcript_15543/g.23152  ORF Transcript_15543/g.23152 Transcript_15543/m.23152 type:complete len:350 (+) Transcript_15543:131-1180(+)|eukprot:CAMPEP_0171461356 /NCGR_PEP_ID=MMETSP0945-20130129/5836_1 /TAXON_ID=109269 /ORGANISM="Vaucheria litorea, Strain CCMP2940" /LENGTH=349 /DNA_ID=CAMNT_0011987685 /DNA_START=124 /DNA_END=1173 /DNA_ORIENTATION=+
MGEGEEIVSLLFYIVIVYPACNWILTSKRFTKKKSIYCAIAFLASIGIGKVAIEWIDKGPNHYRLLNVHRTSTPLELKKAYKNLSRELHPDKNPSPEAAEQFSTMKEAYDTLMDLEFRDVYNKLGPEALKSNQRIDETQLLMQIGVQYIVWGVIAYVLTMGKSGASARSCIFTGEIIMLILEVSNISTGQGNSLLPSWLLPSVADYEVIWMMRSLFPAYMNGCRSICGFLYVDVEKQTRDLLLAIQKGHNDIILQQQLLQNEIKDLVNEVRTKVGSAGVGKLTNAAQNSVAKSSNKQSPASLLRDLEERELNAKNVDLLATPIEMPSKGRSNFWWIVGAYAVFYYFFQQ